MNLSILDRIIEKKSERIRREKEEKPVERLIETLRRERPARRNFKHSLDRPDGISIIAEVKQASPSAGILRKNFNPADIIKEYEEGGADAISVITEEDFFLGSPDTLRLVRSFSSRPALMKDFIIDDYQIYSAACLGADCVLLITKLLSAGQLTDFIKTARELGLDSLVEVHNRAEMDAALAAGAEIIGINNRNLETFKVDISTTLELGPLLPDNIVKVSESGIKTPNDISVLASAGINAVLIGEALIRSGSPGEELRKLRK